MSEDVQDDVELPTNTNDEISVDNGSFQSSIDYPVTAQMRLDLAMSQIQKYASLADFDDEAEALRKEWGAYYKVIKPLIAEGKYEDLFNVALPEQA
ncbi:hypothetical protein CRM79_05020 [Pantoea agglomerans]|nr:hypothetical protein [Pantoea agglomerans]PEI02627.1 hypothetical protein CRM79_05020 [Pantoea agglomerans]